MSLRRMLPLILIVLGATLGFILLRDRIGFDVLRDNRLALLLELGVDTLELVLFLGEFFPFRNALQVLDAFLQAQLLLVGQRDDGVTNAALQVGELRVEVSGVFVEVLFAQAL